MPHPRHMEVTRLGSKLPVYNHSHSNMGSKLHLRPTPQFTATPTEQAQELNPRLLFRLITAEPRWELLIYFRMSIDKCTRNDIRKSLFGNQYRNN